MGSGSKGVSFGFSPDPIPEKVLAYWITPDQKVHEKIVTVAAKIPHIQCFSGSIFYMFHEDDVVVESMSKALQDRNMRFGKNTVP